MTSSARFEEAKKWIESIEPRWRLQVLSKKFRIDKETGERTELPTRIRRFVEGVPWALVQDSIDYLLSIAPYSDIMYNGVKVDGTYRPTITSWTRDDKDQTVSKTSIKTNDGTYTLIQDLIEDGLYDSYKAATSGSCSEEVITEWHWDETGLVDIPPPAQGVTYVVQAVSRNEDGTFDYALVKRIAKTQHSAETLLADDPFTRTTEETWDNVYGAPGSFYGNGIDVVIPSAGTSGGTKTEVRTSENQDCTFKVSVTRTTSKSADQSRMTENDVFSHKSTDVKRGANTALPDAPAASGGVTHRHESQLQPDGTYTTSKTVEAEQSVETAVEEVSVGRKGRRSTKVNRNVSSPLPTSSVAVGGSVKNEKTPGGLFNTTLSEWVRGVITKVGDICRIDLFSHRHTVERSGVDVVPETDVSGSGQDGKVITRTTRMDDDGAIVESVETETELPVEKARESWTVGLFGLRHHIERRNQTTPESAPASGVANVGKTVTNERTPGGLYNTSVDELDRSAPDMTTGKDCAKTIFEHSDTETVRSPNGSIPGHVDEAGNGKHTTRSSSLNEDGSVTVRTVTVNETAVPDAEVTFQKTRRAVIETHTTKNGTKVASKPDNIGSMRRHSRTQGGRYDLTETDAHIEEGQVDSGFYRGSALTKSNDEVVMSVGKTVKVEDEGFRDDKSVKTVTADVDEYGVIKTVTRVEKEKTDVELSSSKEKMARGTVNTVTVRKAEKDPSEPTNIGDTISNRITDAGNADVTVRTVTVSSTPDSAAARTTALTKTNDQVALSTVTAVTPYSEEYTPVGGGYTTSKTKELDQYGIQKETVRIEYEKAGGLVLSETKDKVKRGVITTTTRRESAKQSSEPAHIGESVSSRMTEAGNFDITEKKVTTSAQVDVGRSYGDYLGKSHDNVSCNAKDTANVPEVGVQNQGSSVLVTEEIDEYGIARTIRRVDNPSPMRSAFSKCDLDASKVATLAFANASEGEIDGFISRVASEIKVSVKKVNGSDIYPSGQTVSVSMSINKFGLLDGHVTGHLSYPSTVLSDGAEYKSFGFQVYHRSVSPLYHTVEQENSNTMVTNYKKVIISYYKNCVILTGVGIDSLNKAFGGTVGDGSYVRYNFSDGSWTATFMSATPWMYDIDIEDGGTVLWTASH